VGPLSLVDAVVLLGVAVVLPLALGGRWEWWTGAVAGLAVALLLDPGPVAALLVVPWVAASGATLVTAVQRAGPQAHWRLDDGVAVLASAYAVVAAGALSASRLGASPFGVTEPIVALTAVHYTYAGSGALILAGLAGAAPAGAAGGSAAVGRAWPRWSSPARPRPSWRSGSWLATRCPRLAVPC
jgi:hypothetical protein